MATRTPISEAPTIDVERLRACVRGPVILPADPGYDAARAIWNGAIDRRPACIVRCTGVADVVAAVGFRPRARPAGGGALRRPRRRRSRTLRRRPRDRPLADEGIRVDPVARTARAEAGVLWGELDRETQLHGLATVGGIVTHTGIAGLTLGGGIGWLMRKHGATVDNLVSVDLVTADGEVLTASEDKNPDLFWGLRR